MMPRCMICLEGGPEVPPPCLKLATPCFHRRCLEMAWAAQQEERQKQPVCPHCNEPLPLAVMRPLRLWTAIDLGSHRIESTLQRWFQSAGCWVQLPKYMRAKEGLLEDAESQLVLSRWAEQIVLFLKPLHHAAQPKQEEKEGLWTHSCLFDQEDMSVKITVSLSRAAVVDGKGCFVKDGYLMGAQQTRFLPSRASRH
jgi:hypothetical protein